MKQFATCLLLLLAPHLPTFGLAQNYDFCVLEQFLDANLNAFEGKVVVLIERDGERLYTFERGDFTEDTKRGVASATKWMAGSIILSLADEGWYDLDDRVGDYLPVMEANGKGDFTIRQAFSMSSGLFDNSRPHTDPTLTLEQSVAVIAANVPFIFEPGEGVAYDGKQMQVAGYLAQTVTGQDWRELAQTRLFSPCGMEDTTYDRFGSNNPAVAGGIQTTAADYMRFLSMVMNGGYAGQEQVLSATALEELFTNQTAGLPIIETPIPETSDWFPNGDGEWHYGFGSWVVVEDTTTGEVIEATSPGAWGTHPWVDRERNLYGIFFTDVPVRSEQTTQVIYHAWQLIRNAVDNVDRRAVRLGHYKKDYFDPEFLSSENLMAFQDAGAGNIWLTPLEPRTGFFRDSVTGQNIFINGNVTPLLESNNGPEFGLDADGWAIFYPKPLEGTHRIWRTTWDGLTTQTMVLTGADSHRANIIPTRNINSPDTMMMYLKGLSGEGGQIAWSSEFQPEQEQEFLYYIRGGIPVKWIPDSRNIAMVRARDGETNRRLIIYDTTTGIQAEITDGTTDIDYPEPFLAPELNGELLIGAVENNSTVVVFRNTGQQYWERYSSLVIPEASRFQNIAAMESFSFRDQSFFTVQIERDSPEPIQPAEIWIYGIDDDPARRIALRCDDGSDLDIRRTDTEYYIGTDDVYVFYNVVSDSFQYEIWRCKSGLGQILDQAGGHHSVWVVH